MSSTSLEVVFIVLLVLANGFLAMSELAIFSSRKVRLQQWASRGNEGARRALRLAQSPGKFLSTVQTGMTLVGILAGAFGGATVAERLAAALQDVPLLGPYRQAIALGVVVLAITALTLIFGELVPKRLGIAHAERIAAAVSGPSMVLARLGAPAVWLLTAITEAILKLAGIRASTEAPVTEEEMRILLDQATEAGTFQAAERDMLNGVIRLGNRTVTDVMTPKKDVDWLDVDAPAETVRRIMRESRHQRFPVARGDLDNVLGMVQSKDLLMRLLQGQNLDLKACIKQPLYVPEGTPALRVLEMLKAHPIHAAVVLDEYGALQGVVSLNDILVSLTPGTLNALSELEGTVVRREDGSWLLDGVLPVDETKEALGIHTLEGEERGYFHTLAGFVMLRLGKIPRTGDHFLWGGFRFEVVDMDGLRIDKVLVARETVKPEDAGE